MSATASVIITSYNNGRYLDQAIRSAVEQPTPPQVVVVDDGSTDRSADVLRTWGTRVLAVTQPNGGQAAALNAGISRATGEIVLLLDGDDWCETNRIERVVRELERSTQALWVRHDMREVDACGRKLADAKYRFDPTSSALSELERFSRPLGSTSGLAFRRSFLTRLGAIPDDYRINPDWYLMAAAALAGQCLTLVDSLTCRRMHSGQASHHQGRWDEARCVWSLTEKLRMAADADRLARRFHPTSPLATRNTWWQRKAGFDGRKAALVQGSSVPEWLLMLSKVARSGLPWERILAEAVRGTALAVVPRRWFKSVWWATHHGRPITRLEDRVTTSALAARREPSVKS